MVSPLPCFKKMITNLQTRKKTLFILETLERTDENALSQYIAKDATLSVIEKVLEFIPGTETYLPEIINQVSKSKTGSMLFWGEQNKYLIIPPFPVEETVLFQDCELKPLKNILIPDRMIALILVRLNRYGIGLFKGTSLLSSKVGTGLIHSRHKKGGSSQHRYERHREKQIEYFFTRACIRTREQIEPYLKILDGVCYGGEHNTVQEFVGQCKFVQKLEDIRMDKLLDIREPKQETLKAAIEQVYCSKVIKLEIKNQGS
jgi:hypothetical protein